MNIRFTGRILDWFVKDLKALTARGVEYRVLPGQEKPYRPPGLWCVTPPRAEYPLLWSFPQPLHPIEAVASLRGFGGHSRDIEQVKVLATARSLPWLEYTTTLAGFLFVSPETVRLVWHLLTPLNVPPHNWRFDTDDADAMLDAEEALWVAATGRGRPRLVGAGRGPMRHDFWTGEVTPRDPATGAIAGGIEL